MRDVVEARGYTATDGTHHTGIEAVIHCLLDIGYNSGEQTKDRMYALDKAVDRGYSKAKESLEISGGISPDQQALLDALRMTPHERRLAQDSTAAEDDQAMADLVESGDVVGE